MSHFEQQLSDRSTELELYLPAGIYVYEVYSR